MSRDGFEQLDSAVVEALGRHIRRGKSAPSGAVARQHLARDYILAGFLRGLAYQALHEMVDTEQLVMLLLAAASTVESGLQQHDWVAILEDGGKQHA